MVWHHEGQEMWVNSYLMAGSSDHHNKGRPDPAATPHTSPPALASHLHLAHFGHTPAAAPMPDVQGGARKPGWRCHSHGAPGPRPAMEREPGMVPRAVQVWGGHAAGGEGEHGRGKGVGVQVCLRVTGGVFGVIRCAS